MLVKLVKAYSHFFDNRISDSTLVVGIISVLIVLVGYFAHHHDTQAYKASALEISNSSSLDDTGIVTINGKKYKIILEEIK